ncbi:AbrB/MazE/SpoVT family DNA-binding domain-containing protein, partial [Halobium palmae]
METRKVQLTGSSTFTISLPKEWATEQGIDP